MVEVKITPGLILQVGDGTYLKCPATEEFLDIAIRILQGIKKEGATPSVDIKADIPPEDQLLDEKARHNIVKEVDAQAEKLIKKANAKLDELSGTNLDCPHCDFSASTLHGLKVHLGRMHLDPDQVEVGK